MNAVTVGNSTDYTDGKGDGYDAGYLAGQHAARAENIEYVARWAAYIYPARGPIDRDRLLLDLAGLATRARARAAR